jgi:hypothetical protein
LNSYDFNRPLVGLDGQPMPVSPQDPSTVMLGQILSNMLVQSQSNDPIKVWGWAQKMYRGEPLLLDESDREKLSGLIMGLKTAADLLKAQALTVLRQPI